VKRRLENIILFLGNGNTARGLKGEGTHLREPGAQLVAPQLLARIPCPISSAESDGSPLEA
jgi:hypothetical protein